MSFSNLFFKHYIDCSNTCAVSVAFILSVLKFMGPMNHFVGIRMSFSIVCLQTELYRRVRIKMNKWDVFFVVYISPCCASVTAESILLIPSDCLMPVHFSYYVGACALPRLLFVFGNEWLHKGTGSSPLL